MKFKICGLRRPKDILYINRTRPDFAGFVFVPGRRRCVDVSTARVLSHMLDGSITPVGVFADQPISFVTELVTDGVIQAVQLHGAEDNNYITALRKMLNDRGFVTTFIIKAFSIDSSNSDKDADSLSASIRNCAADAILLDSGKGGSGESWDHRLAATILRPALQRRPFFLAGGLTPENAAAAAKRVRPYALDVSSGVETNGIKDPEKITAFAAAVRRI